jgi:hypothetical protein
MGAGGKMGCRIVDVISTDPAYELRCVEPAEDGIERLRERDLDVTDPESALPGSEAVILAVPDEVIGEVTRDVVDLVDDGTIIVLLDPAAAHAGVLPEAADVTYFITHPCHPSFFTAETEMDDEEPDWFGGQGRDDQDIVCALHSGPDSDYVRGEAIARDIYAPVRRCHRLTTEQMVLLEPALVESLLSTCMAVVREGLERVVDEGVPRQAAEDFLFGHMRISIGLIFGFTEFPYSDGANAAMETAREDLFREDWAQQVFGPENLQESVDRIADVDC